MVQLAAVQATNAELVKTDPFVAVCAGATAGIGECAVRAIATNHAKHGGKTLRVYIVGRNEQAAEKIIADCRTMCPKGQFRFVQAQDLALLKEVDRICKEIIEAEKTATGPDGVLKVDFLCLSQGVLTFEKRRDTIEGLDNLMSINYYSRMRFVVQLLPLLTASPLPGHVVSVFNPRWEGKFVAEDLSLRDPKHYGFTYGSSHMVLMTTFFMENLAARNPGKLALIHCYPGIIQTNSDQRSRLPNWVKLLFRFVIMPLLRPFAMPLDECGERMLFLASSRYAPRSASGGEQNKESREQEVIVASDRTIGGGAYKVDSQGEAWPSGKAYDDAKAAGLYEKAWEHTMDAFNTIEKGEVFTR